jgi:Apea-like HEPN
MSLAYQLLALDPAEKTRCKNALSLLYLIRGFTSLWNSPKLDEKHCRISDGALSLSVTAVVDSEPDAPTHTDDFGRAFILTLSGSYDDVESRREPVASFLKDQEFELLYVLRDQESEQIACKLYPHLYRIENLLRGYLIRFMATRIGPNWWELTASSEMSDKAKMRKKNERVFGKHVETSAYLIDFDELGEIVYEQSSGLLTREDIVHRVAGLAETPEAIRALKQDMQSNYQKLFKESFADKNFKDKWKQFESLRNKIAHNNLFTAGDLAAGEQLANELTDIISVADAEAAKLVITSEERDAIREQVSV